MTPNVSIPTLLFKHLSGNLTEEETITLNQWVQEDTNHQQLFTEINDENQLATTLAIADPTTWSETRNRLLLRIQSEINKNPLSIAPSKKPVQKLSWLKYAAAIIILISGTCAYLLLNIEKKNPITIVTTPVQDVSPGGNKAILVLGDGTKIILDTAANGKLTSQGTTDIIKQQNGEIKYKLSASNLISTVLNNTMSTPRGGQYKLTLPDNSQVWLNAESSITYPTSFTSATRTVTITGEAYFEVSHNANQPFIVKTNSDSITVVGTHFNVNTYNDASTFKTSLLEGSIKIKDKLLKPGQAFTNGNVTPTNLDQDIAWKNGLFQFDHTPMPVVFSQLARWYDIKVVYEKAAPTILFSGKLLRNLTLKQVIKILNEMEVHCELSADRTLIVK